MTRIAFWTTASVAFLYFAIYAVLKLTTPRTYDMLYTGSLTMAKEGSRQGWYVASNKAYDDLKKFEKETEPKKQDSAAKTGSCFWWITEVMMKAEGVHPESSFKIEIIEKAGAKVAVSSVYFDAAGRGQKAAEGSFSCERFLPFDDCIMHGEFKYWDPAGKLLRTENWVNGVLK